MTNALGTGLLLNHFDVYAMAIGLAYGSFQAINAAVYAHYFGRKHAGEIRGTTFVITIVGAALGPLPFGWAAAHGGYGPVLMAGAVLCMIAIVANFGVDRPSARWEMVAITAGEHS